jgi:dihydrofolate reductase
MSRLVLDISVSLDGFVAGPNPTLELPLGEGGEQLHEWVVRLESWRRDHGLEGGEPGPDNELVAEWTGRTGAFIMGRRMFSGGEGPWEADPNRNAWWGDDPPFAKPVFVLTHHERAHESFSNGTTYDFVTDGIEPALERARAAAGGKDVGVSGGAEVAQQYLAAGLLDEIQLHVVPVLLGGGTRLFDSVPAVTLEQTRVLHSPAVTHVRYRVVR